MASVFALARQREQLHAALLQGARRNSLGLDNFLGDVLAFLCGEQGGGEGARGAG